MADDCVVHMKLEPSAALLATVDELKDLARKHSLPRETCERIFDVFSDLENLLSFDPELHRAAGTRDCSLVFDPSETFLKFVSALRTGEVDRFLIEIESHRSLLRRHSESTKAHIRRASRQRCPHTRGVPR